MTQGAKYGIGALQQGVWYFAFGANISPKKLTGARNITPLESRAATLPGYRLAFNHRCEMREAPLNHAAAVAGSQGRDLRRVLLFRLTQLACNPECLLLTFEKHLRVTLRRGAMGNLMRLGEGEAAPSGMTAVHGVAHRLRPTDFAKLTNMEHEYL